MRMNNSSILLSGNSKFFWWLLLANAFTFNVLLAQVKPANTRVQGTVIGTDKVPLQGASVKVKNKTATAITDAAGKFTITASINDTLVISYVNFSTQTIKITKLTGLQIILIDGKTDLEDVIVIGYGTVKRKDLTGSVAKANVEDMQKANVTSFVDALAGRVAGAVVSSGDGQPGATSSIVIRGSSVSQDASPLFVVDGFPIENLDINSINPNDIESIEVLKDASSIAIYGARGANGVIIVTTRRGKSGATKVTYNFSQAFQHDTKRLALLSPYEFVKLQLELDSIRSTPTVQNTTYRNRYLDPTKGITLESYRNMKGYNWQDLLLQTGILQTHSLNINGGNSDTRFSVNGSFVDQKGIILNTGLKKYDGKFALDSKLNANVKVALTASYSSTTSFGTVPTANNGGGVVFNMWSFRPVDIIGGNLGDALIDSSTLGDNGATTSVPDNLVSPLQQAQNEYRKNITNTGTINASLEYTFLTKFKLRLAGGYTATSPKAETFYNSKTSQGSILKNSAGQELNSNLINGSITNGTNSNYLFESTLSYRTKVSKHVFDAIAGFTYQYASSYNNSFKSIRIPQATEYLGILSINGGTATLPSYFGTQWQLYSLLSRLNYTYNDRYLLTVTARADGSSKFAPGHQWGYFPSSAFAWRFTNEKFASEWTSFLNEGKLRVSYGSVGNNKVGDFSYLSQFGSLQNSAGYPINNTYLAGIVPFFYGNTNLTWETTKELDFGGTFSFLKDRISIETDYYQRKTSNFLIAVTLPFFAGYGTGNNTQYQNTGDIQNSGFEFTLNTVNIKNTRFAWTTSFNISFNKSKVLDFYNGLEVRQQQAALTGVSTAAQPTTWIAAVGGPISQFYGYQWAGVYQYSDFNKLANGTYVLKPNVPSYALANASAPIQPGDPKYADINGDGIIDANDQKVIGHPLPIHTGGLSNNFTYKNWSLNIFLQWSYGNDILNANRIVLENSGYILNSNQFASYANRWTPNNPTNDIPRATYNSKVDPGGLTRISSRFIEDGSYLRFKTIALNYALPMSVIKKLKITNARLYVSAQNIFTLTKYSGLDPEVSTYRAANPANGDRNSGGTGYSYIQPSSSYTALSPGYDYTPYPRAFTLTFGAAVTF